MQAMTPTNLKRLRKRSIQLCTLIFTLILSHFVQAHGGVVLEEDLCIIKIGFYQAHFTIFQPRSQAHEQFCEDLPDTGETVFVVEYLHNGLEDLPVDFRIVRNTTNLGRYATWEDVQAIDDLQAITVFYHPPKREPDVLAYLHDFDTSGDFIGVVTALHPDTQVLYTAVFPFAVGSYGLDYRAVTVACVTLVPLIFWLFSWRRKKTRLQSLPAAGLCAFACLFGGDLQAAEQADYAASGAYFQVSVDSSLSPIVINKIHNWRVRIVDMQGEPVANAQIAIEGGMLEHDHGLPTAPKMTSSVGDGVYLIEGMKFHMSGAWQVQLTISAAGATDITTIYLDL